MGRTPQHHCLGRHENRAVLFKGWSVTWVRRELSKWLPVLCLTNEQFARLSPLAFIMICAYSTCTVLSHGYMFRAGGY